MVYPEMINFWYFFENSSIHKYCRAVLNADLDSASNSASDSILLMARQYFLGVDNWGYSWCNTWKWSISDLFSRIPLFTSIAGQFWMQIHIQHQILHLNQLHWWPGNISLRLIFRVIHCVLPRNGQFSDLFSRIPLFTSIAGQFWVQIQSQHQLLYLMEVTRRPGHTSFR